MSPRKSSTSSGRPPRVRARYLGVEVVGEPLPPLSPRWWEATLRRAFDRTGVPGRFRLVRSEGARAILEVDQWRSSRARAAATGGTDGNGALALRTHRTWGTLRPAKAWLRGR